MDLISQTDALVALCAQLRTQEFVALDTEFMREATYWPKLCLVQAAAGPIEALIDPLAPGLDLTPLFDLLQDDAVTKVMHAARQDIEIFWNLSGKAPYPLFDTQVAAMAAGYGDSIAYDALVQSLLRRRVDKSSRFTDWSRRPLSDAQLAYALADVTHLRDLYPKLHGQLERRGRLHWLVDEMALLVDPQNYDTDPENAWMRLRTRKTNADYLAALRAAAAWRERIAQAKDIPRARVLKDDALLEIAEQRPTSPAALNALRAVPKGFGGSRQGEDLADAIHAALQNAADYAPTVEQSAPLPPSLGPVVELLKVLLKGESERIGVAARLIATTADLEAIALDDDAPVAALSGWRREVFGQRALDLKHGKLALSIRNRRVVASLIAVETTEPAGCDEVEADLAIDPELTAST